MSRTKVVTIGLGYIGLPTSALIAQNEIIVQGVDINQNVVDTVNSGNVHIIEPDLDAMVKNVVDTKFLRASISPEPANAFLICVPTPFKKDYTPDLSFIESAANAIAPVLKKGNLIILESTSPVGATEQLSEWLANARPDLIFPKNGSTATDIHIAYCPERILPGQMLRELVENDRVIGGLTAACSEAAKELYGLFVEGNCITTNARTAEMCKLVENSFRDLNIAFANELSIICDQQNIDTWELISVANRHPRVNILQPGVGVGGHCIAVDPYFIISQNPDTAKLISVGRQVNKSKTSYVIQKIASKAEKENTKNVIVLGITFKPDIDDVRESPALLVVTQLLSEGYEIKVIEPNLTQLPDVLSSKGVQLINSIDDLGDDDHCVVAVLVSHKAFKANSDKLLELDALDFCGVTK